MAPPHSVHNRSLLGKEIPDMSRICVLPMNLYQPTRCGPSPHSHITALLHECVNGEQQI